MGRSVSAPPRPVPPLSGYGIAKLRSSTQEPGALGLSVRRAITGMHACLRSPLPGLGAKRPHGR